MPKAHSPNAGSQIVVITQENLIFVFSPYKTFVIDMFISPDGKNIHHLHTSAQTPFI